MLNNGERFTRDKSFEQLNPQYDVTANDIQAYIQAILERNKI